MNPRSRIAAVAVLLAVAAISCWWPRGEHAEPLSVTDTAAAGTAAAETTEGKRRANAALAGTEGTASTTVDARSAARTAAPGQSTFRIHGTLSRNGQPVSGRTITCGVGSNNRRRSVETGPDGAFEFRVAPGLLEVAVPTASGTPRQQQTYARWPPELFTSLLCAGESIEVVDRDVRCDFTLPTGAIAVRAIDAKTFQPLAAVDFTWRPPVPVMQELVREGDAAGMARFEDAVPGKHEIVASKRGYVSASIELEVGDRTASGEIELQPTGALDVRLVDEQGKALEISAAQKVHVLCVQTSAVLSHTNIGDFAGKSRPRVLQYDDLMPGQHFVGVEPDSVREGSRRVVRFRPTESRATLDIEVQAGKVARVDIPVRCRCYAELRGIDASGRRARGSLRVEWLDPAGVAEILPAPWFNARGDSGYHFEGYLVPGTYSLVFTDGDRTHRATLTVDRAAVDHSVPLPW